MLSGAQHPLAQSAPVAQSAAQVPPPAVEQVSFAQQSRLDVQEPPGATQVDEQNPRPSQVLRVGSFARGAQQPELHSAPLVQGVAQRDGSPAMTGISQMPEQHALGVLVQLAPTARQAGVLFSGVLEEVVVPLEHPVSRTADSIR